MDIFKMLHSFPDLNSECTALSKQSHWPQGVLLVEKDNEVQ